MPCGIALGDGRQANRGGCAHRDGGDVWRPWPIGWTWENISLGNNGSGDADEEVEMPGDFRSTAGAVHDRKLAGLIEPVVVAAGMDLESVRMTTAGKRRKLSII